MFSLVDSQIITNPTTSLFGSCSCNSLLCDGGGSDSIDRVDPSPISICGLMLLRECRLILLWAPIDLKNNDNSIGSKMIVNEPTKQKISTNENIISSPIKEKNIKSPDKKIGKRVKVWFDDQHRYYSGVVKEKTDENDKYMVKFDIRKKIEEVELLPQNETKDTSNDERWITES